MNRTDHFRGMRMCATKPAPASESQRPTARWRVAAPLCAAISLITLLVFAAPAASPAPPPAPTAAAPQVVVLSINGEIEPILAEYLDDGIAQANESHAALVLITMNTPGGLEDSMQDIIQHILASQVPVAVYVSPSGSRGASAGFYILLSADIAAMAPATHTGSASPLIEIGGTPVTIDETLKNKIMSDSTAFLRSYAAKRGRNVPLAETAVTDAKAFTETEALDGKLIDIVAKSNDDLIAQLDGRTITRFDGETQKLSLAGAQFTNYDMSVRQQFLSRIVEPDVFFILLLVGVLGLYAEFTHPGMVAPGVIGGIALVLALFAMHILPVNFAGLLLVVLALVLFILEAKYTSHGVLAIGGIVAMLLGALMLIHSPMTGAGVSLGTALGVTLPFAVIVIFLMRLVLRSRAWRPQVGAEQLVGQEAEVTSALIAADSQTPGQFSGMVRMHGELWRAAAHETIPLGANVRVTRVEGLTLHVKPADAHAPPAAH
jgi:membrane-bound serine protease (ClpP class)